MTAALEGPCMALVWNGPFDLSGHRCMKRWDDEIHDPLTLNSHCYDNLPILAEDEA